MSTVNRTFVFKDPVPVIDNASQIDWAQPRKEEGDNNIREDHAEALAKIWYEPKIFGICYTKGEADSTRSRAGRGSYGRFRIGTIYEFNLNSTDTKEDAWLLVAQRTMV